MLKNEINKNFPISEKEFLELDKKFIKLIYFYAHLLKKSNFFNNYTEDFEDVSQELRVALMTAASYYKRQVYIEKCLKIAKKHVKDKFVFRIINELCKLWLNRTRHGAHRQKFGGLHEQMLQNVIEKVVPKDIRPNKTEQLIIDTKFSIYAKQCVLNHYRAIGRGISKEKSIRTGIVSLSEFDHMSCPLNSTFTI